MMRDNYKDLIKRLKEYSYTRKGEIARLTYDASIAITILLARIEELEGTEDDGK